MLFFICNFMILKAKLNYKFIILKKNKIKLSVYMRMLNLTISGLRSIAKGRNIDCYENV